MKTISILKVTLLTLTGLFTTFCAIAQSSVTVVTPSICQTQIVTLNCASENNTATASYSLSTNQIITFSSAVGKGDIYYSTTFNTNSYYCNETYNGSSNVNPPQQTFIGLTSISIDNSGSASFAATFTILTPSTNSVTYTPANSVVIPTSATGNVQIILQSSSDLVNWVPSMPGTYGNTYSNRFFRVIAVAQ